MVSSWSSLEVKSCRSVIEKGFLLRCVKIHMVEYFGHAKGTFASLFLQDAADAASSAMVSVIGLNSDKVQLLCDAANEEVDEKDKVQIANYLCPVRLISSR
jgi:hypothetical protein